jgi:hypothetical protein
MPAGSRRRHVRKECAQYNHTCAAQRAVCAAGCGVLLPMRAELYPPAVPSCLPGQDQVAAGGPGQPLQRQGTPWARHRPGPAHVPFPVVPDLICYLLPICSYLLCALQGIDPDSYAPVVDFRDPITRYTSIQGYLFNIQFLRRAFDPLFVLHDLRIDPQDPNAIVTRCKPGQSSPYAARQRGPRVVRVLTALLNVGGAV